MPRSKEGPPLLTELPRAKVFSETQEQPCYKSARVSSRVFAWGVGGKDKYCCAAFRGHGGRVDEQLHDASQQTPSADARLRYYAHVPKVTDAQVEQARRNWDAAQDKLWSVLEEQLEDRTELEEVYAAFTQATDALLVLIDTLGEPEPPEA